MQHVGIVRWAMLNRSKHERAWYLSRTMGRGGHGCCHPGSGLVVGKRTSLRGRVGAGATSTVEVALACARARPGTLESGPRWTLRRLTRGPCRCWMARYSVPCHIS